MLNAKNHIATYSVNNLYIQVTFVCSIVLKCYYVNIFYFIVCLLLYTCKYKNILVK